MIRILKNETEFPKILYHLILRLRKSSIKFIFATNTTKESKQNLLDRLTSLGFKIKKDEIFTSLTAAGSLIKQQNLKPYLVLEDNAKKDFGDICDVNSQLNECNSLVIGLANKLFNYKDMNDYFNFLHNNDRILIGINKSRYYQTRNGLCLGAGAFLSCLEYATNKKAIICGKPEETFFRQAIELMEPGLPFENFAMIGDDLVDDVIGAQNLNMIGVLVRTGKFVKEDENNERYKPNFVFDSIVEALDAIIDASR